MLANGDSMREVTAKVVVGADGIHSAIRKQFYPDEGDPIYSGITWGGQQLGLSLSVMGDLEIYSWDAALAHTGTYVRASLLFSSVAAIPAVIILRLVAFERVRFRKAVTAPPSAPPEDPAA